MRQSRFYDHFSFLMLGFSLIWLGGSLRLVSRLDPLLLNPTLCLLYMPPTWVLTSHRAVAPEADRPQLKFLLLSVSKSSKLSASLMAHLNRDVRKAVLND